MLGFLEMNEDVVPAERNALLLLEFCVEDVDQRKGCFKEGSPNDELLPRRA
jgi:hypothetical protein